MPTHIEHVAAKVMGAAKQAKGAIEGLSGIFRTLMQEHGEASALLLRLKASGDPELRRRLFPLIRKELLSHEKGEIAVLYPALGQYEETASITAHHNGEAQTIEAKIQRLQELDVNSSDWGPALDALIEVVQHHVHEEENNFFPKGELAMGSAKAEDLELRYTATKNEVMSRL
jgi:iron-sulfur cluster repair protein YtfE (RIC family)